jgi:CheY-like chemotaxis protein
MQKHDMTVGVNILTRTDVRLPENQILLLFQSVRELLINASKHAGTGQANVTLDHRDDLLHITVSDHGKGFDSAAVTSVLTADGTPNETLSSKFGLFTIRERMKALGGNFEVEAAPGKGTTCVLTLPLNMAIPQSTGTPNHVSEVSGQSADVSNSHVIPVTNAEAPQGTVVSLLLVDDHAMVRQGLRAILDSYANVHVVGEACNGQEAVELTDQLKPSVVVMDINMPVMNGIEATKHIKIRHPHIIVVGLSVNANGENQHAMKRAGASILLTKEAAAEQLYTSIKHFLQATV